MAPDLDLSSLLLELLIIIAGAALFRQLARSVGQAGVVGEIVLGVLIGPSLLGWASPDLHEFLFPVGNIPFLEALSWIGLILFLFVAGSETRWNRGDATPTFFVALGGLYVPFAIGFTIAAFGARWFFPNGGQATFGGVVVVCIVLTVSALAVLARILEDENKLATRFGALSLGAATIDDVAAWILLGAVITTPAAGFVAPLLGIKLLLVLALIITVVLLNPWIGRLVQHDPKNAPAHLFVWLLLAVFGSALLTHALSLHAVLGPFAVGAIASRHPALREYVEARLGGVSRVILLPSFFILAGARVDFTQLELPGSLLALLLLFLAATFGKVVGCYIGGRAAGLPTRDSLSVGFLLNARGAVGLVVATVGLDSGLISQQGFTLLVATITLTTMLAPIGFHVVRRVLPNVPPPRRRHAKAKAA